MHAAVFRMDNQQCSTIEHRELCSMMCGGLDGGEFRGEWMHVYVWLSSFSVHLKLLRIVSWLCSNINKNVTTD